MTNLNPRAVRPLRINWRSRLNKRPWMASYWALFRNELFLIPFLGLKASSFQSSVKRKSKGVSETNTCRKKYARVTKLLFCSNSLVKSWSTPAAGQWPPSFSYIRTAHVNWWLVYLIVFKWFISSIMDLTSQLPGFLLLVAMAHLIALRSP